MKKQLLSGSLLLALSLSFYACKKNEEPTTEKGHLNNRDGLAAVNPILILKDDKVKHVAYAKVNSGRITDIGKFKLELTKAEQKTNTAQNFFDIAIVFESAKILPAKSAKLRGETGTDLGDYVLAYKEWSSSSSFSPSAKALSSGDLYNSGAVKTTTGDAGRYSLTMNNELKKDILDLKATGITVLMDIIPDHENAGWKSFDTQDKASKFAKQINESIKLYQYDGIDIDEEWAKYTGATYKESILRVLYELKKLWKTEDYLHPGKVLITSKALFSDSEDFSASIKVDKQKYILSDLLDYGWEMTYQSSFYAYRLSDYETAGMTKARLGLGIDFSDGLNDEQSGTETAKYVKDNAYKFVMYYDVKGADLSRYSAISNLFYKRNLTLSAN
nr:glycosyl hydrolase family 18 protein [Pedobacter sp. ASV2]